VQRAANTLIVSLFLALLGGMGFLSLLRNNAALCVKFSCAVQITIPTAVGALRARHCAVAAAFNLASR
jgi:hypothetical protein